MALTAAPTAVFIPNDSTVIEGETTGKSKVLRAGKYVASHKAPFAFEMKQTAVNFIASTKKLSQILAAGSRAAMKKIVSAPATAYTAICDRLEGELPTPPSKDASGNIHLQYARYLERTWGIPMPESAVA